MKRTRFMAVLIPLALACPPANAHQVETPTLRIVHPNTTEPADPSDKDIVVLMTIENKGHDADRLIAARCALAESAIVVGGPTSGTAASVELPAGKTTEFSRTGPHIELKGLTEEFAGYETFVLTVTFEKAGNVDLEVLVEPADDQPHVHHN